MYGVHATCDEHAVYTQCTCTCSVRAVHAVNAFLQDAVGLAPVEEQLLLLQVVEDQRPPQRHVFLRLLKREARRVEGNQRLAQWPLFDRLVEQRFVAEVDHLELDQPARRERGETVEHLGHRRRPRLLVHRTDAHEDRTVFDTPSAEAIQPGGRRGAARDLLPTRQLFLAPHHGVPRERFLQSALCGSEVTKRDRGAGCQPVRDQPVHMLALSLPTPDLHYPRL